MRCVVCRQADVRPGLATVTLERERLTLVIKHESTRVCPNCGEEYVDEHVMARLLASAEELARAGELVDVRDYVAAA
jgi:YgiT-type zinc finger domain-containing protein